MKTIKYLSVIIVITFIKCTPVKEFNMLEPPIVIVGKSESSVTIVDVNNNYVTISSDFALGRSLINSYNKGDTIIYNSTK
jgi:hypothetical protein